MPEPQMFFSDIKGSQYILEECREDCIGGLTQMYDTFSPKPITQGLPPANDELRKEWISRMMNRGINYSAVTEGRVVGHAAILPDFDRLDGEYIIFILDQFRNRGLGSRLTELSVIKAKQLCLKLLWLTVEAYNFRAIRVYRKVGFEFCDEGELERTMQLNL